MWTVDVDADCRRFLQLAREEDLAGGVDCTTEAVGAGEADGHARFVSRQPGVASGLPAIALAAEVFSIRVVVKCMAHDGDAVQAGTVLAGIRGPARNLLALERTCLNLISRLSGIATLTRRYVDAVAGTPATILDTRKTLPGWRRLEKYAVRCGGGHNNRMGLYDAILIKDNHLALLAAQGITEPAAEALSRARAWVARNKHRLPHGEQTIVEVEVDSLDQLRSVLQSQVDIVLLDNMPPEQLTAAVEMRNSLQSQVKLEASGGVDLQTVSRIAAAGVDRISVGALTHSAPGLDVALDWN